MDRITKEQRSAVMSRIRSTNTRPELALKSVLEAAGVWHFHLPPSPGMPDFWVPLAGAVVFIDGCFWHGCPRHYREPKSNVKFWRGKIARNRRNGRRASARFRYRGFSALRVWEHEIMSPSLSLRL